VCTLAHVFEAAGLATIVLSSIRDVAVRMHPPRTLHCEFPLGRPLGKPTDTTFQLDVLARAFALLDAPSGPVLADYPEIVEAETEPLACALPPRFDPTLPPAVDEARGLRNAYDRTLASRGVSSVGRTIGANDVPSALQVLHNIATGSNWKEAGIPGGNTTAVVHDIRSYYEEAALSLLGTSFTEGAAPGGRQAEAWFFERTEAGATVLAARAAIQGAGAPRPAWFYMAPGHR
jgi:hypothetical protein